MRIRPEGSSVRCARLVTLVVLVVVVAGIALANLSSEAATADDFKNINTATLSGARERAYGWPLVWYWRIAKIVPGKVPLGWGRTAFRFHWPVSRYNLSRLTANLAIWLTLLGASVVACQRLRPHCRPRPKRRPKVITLLVLIVVSAPIVLANMSFDASRDLKPSFGWPAASFGWPFVWYWHVVAEAQGMTIHGWDYSATRLAINLAGWLGFLAATIIACEWLLRRRRLQFRWSLRTMLVAVGLVGAFCAWWSIAGRRAREQDPLITWTTPSRGVVYVERWGPKWLDIVGADPYRRCIVGAYLDLSDSEEEDNEELLHRFGQLSDLQYLKIAVPRLTASMSAALGDMRRLRVLRIRRDGNAPAELGEFLGAVGKLTQLERLSLDGWGCIESGDPANLAGLTNLKSLSLSLNVFAGDEKGLVQQQIHEWLAAVGRLTGLERLCLSGTWPVRSEELESLRDLENLKSLALTVDVRNDERGGREYLAKVGTLTRLEHLHLYMQRVASGDGLESLHGLVNLKMLTIRGCEPGALAFLPMLPQLEVLGLSGEPIVDDDLERLVGLPRLKCLDLAGTAVSSAGLKQLGMLDSLEELHIDRDTAMPDGFESLIALNHLKAVHISPYPDINSQVTLMLDSGGLRVAPGDEHDWRRALQALRSARTGIVIDATAPQLNEAVFRDKYDDEPPWGWNSNKRVDRSYDYALMRMFVEGG